MTSSNLYWCKVGVFTSTLASAWTNDAQVRLTICFQGHLFRISTQILWWCQYIDIALRAHSCLLLNHEFLWFYCIAICSSSWNLNLLIKWGII